MKRSRLLPWLAFLVCVAITGTSVSQSVVDSLALADTFRVDAAPVIVRSERLRLPFAVTNVLPAGPHSLVVPSVLPALESVPGVWVQSGALNTNRISIRGIGYREPFATSGIKVYLDDIPLTNGAGEASIEDIHPWLFDGVEIWRGPGSALWGAGLGGMIRLRSRRPDSTGLMTRISAGSFGRLQVDQQVDQVRGSKYPSGVSAHYQYLADDGYRDNNTYRKHSITVKPFWQFGPAWRMQAFVHHIELKAGIPSSLSAADFRENPTAAAPTWAAVRGREAYEKSIAGIHWRFLPGGAWSYDGSAFVNGFKSEEVRPFNVLDEQSVSFGSRHRAAFVSGSDWIVQAGLEYFEERYGNHAYEVLPGGVKGEAIGRDRERRMHWQGFSQVEWTPGRRWIVLAGLHAAGLRIRSDTLRVRPSPGLYPMAGLSYKLGRGIVLTGQFSRGYSAMSAAAVRNADGTVDPSIKPETGSNGEVSVRIGDRDRAFLSVGYYRMAVRNTILTRRIRDDEYVRINAGSSTHAGLETAFGLADRKQRIRWQGTYTWSGHRFDRFFDDKGTYDGNRLPGIPVHRLVQRVTFSPARNLAFHVEHQGFTDIFLDDANTITSRGAQVLHAGCQWTMVTGGHWRIHWSLEMNNVLDARYASMVQVNAPGTVPRYYYPARPRSLYAGVTVVPPRR